MSMDCTWMMHCRRSSNFQRFDGYQMGVDDTKSSPQAVPGPRRRPLVQCQHFDMPSSSRGTLTAFINIWERFKPQRK